MDIKPENIFLSKEPKLTDQGDDDSADDGFEEEHEEGEFDVLYKIGKLFS